MRIYKGSLGLRRVVLRVRPFGPNDLTAVASIVKDSLRENYPTSLYLDIHRWWRDGFLVVESGGAVVGFLAAVINAPQQARILMLAVNQPLRRQGIGTALMQYFVNECSLRGVRSIELEVRKSNAEAIPFYTKWGFQIANILPRFYTDGEDGFKMRRHL
jgi:ribosomal-protein-alanine N-acetyltransferase